MIKPVISKPTQPIPTPSHIAAASQGIADQLERAPLGSRKIV